MISAPIVKYGATVGLGGFIPPLFDTLQFGKDKYFIENNFIDFSSPLTCYLAAPGLIIDPAFEDETSSNTHFTHHGLLNTKSRFSLSILL